MDSNQFQAMQSMPPVQPTQPVPQAQSVQPVQPVQPVGSAQPGPGVPSKDNSNIIKTVVMVLTSLAAAIFLILFVWMSIQYGTLKSEFDGKVEAEVTSAVNDAVYKQQQEDLEKFNEEEKYPYKSFVGPADYGQLSFEFPKTWSVYIASDASNGGDYQAYFNPLEVNPISASTVNSLRLTIRDKSFENVAAEYQRYLEQSNSGLSVETMEIAGTTANRYTGNIPNTEFNGVVVIFKIRDKTAVLQTDAMLFVDDFNNILNTVKFNA